MDDGRHSRTKRPDQTKPNYTKLLTNRRNTNPSTHNNNYNHYKSTRAKASSKATMKISRISLVTALAVTIAGSGFSEATDHQQQSHSLRVSDCRLYFHPDRPSSHAWSTFGATCLSRTTGRFTDCVIFLHSHLIMFLHVSSSFYALGQPNLDGRARRYNFDF